MLKSQPDEFLVFGAASSDLHGVMLCTVGCPCEGDIAPERVAYLAGDDWFTGSARSQVAQAPAPLARRVH